MKTLRDFVSDERGQDLIEYALIAIIIALGAVIGMSALAGSINQEFKNIAAKLT